MHAQIPHGPGQRITSLGHQSHRVTLELVRTNPPLGFDIFPSPHEQSTLLAERPPFVGKSTARLLADDRISGGHAIDRFIAPLCVDGAIPGHQLEPAPFALRWLLDQPDVTSVVVGAKQIEHLNARNGA